MTTLHKKKDSLRKIFLLTILFIITFSSCKLPFTETTTRDTDKNTLFLKFSPKPGTTYHYNVENKTELELEVQGKKTEKNSEFDMGMAYHIFKDTSGQYLFETTYDKVHLVSKNDDIETVSDAENVNAWSPPTDRMLGALKETKLVVSVTPGKDIRIVSGYEELSRRLMSVLDTTNPYAKQAAQQKIDETIKRGLIQKNIDQLFRFFPDSAMRIGSKWKVDTKEKQDFTLNVSTFYTLNDINDGVAYLASASTITNDKTPIAMMGYSIVPDLKGEQEGTYQVEAATCMLLNATITSSVKGIITMGTSSIPIAIKLKVTVEGKRL